MKETINKSRKHITGDKKGVTLVMLVVTIIIMIIITSIAVFGVSTFANNGKKTAFATDLKNVQDAVDVYYSDNGSFPSIGNSIILNDLKTLAGDNATILEQEIALNEDTESTYFELDMDKINSTGGNKGRKVNGANDIFVVSSKNMIVYYVSGEKIGSETYFSLTNKLTKGTNFKKDSIDTSAIGFVVESQGIKLTKSKKDWTSDLTITVETVLGTGETASYSVAGVIPTSPVTIVSEVATEIILNSSTMLYPVLSAFNSASVENKTIVVEKKNIDGVTVAKATMSISNLDLQIGTVPSPTIKSYDNDNILDFSSATDIKELRYEYITKWNQGSTVTMSIANPCVVTLNNHGFALNKPIIFTTTGALPAAITSGSTYYVIPVDANTFKLSTTESGSALSTLGGSQSGIHSYSTVENYYTAQPTITKSYMLNTAKKQIGTAISLPKNVKSLAVSIVDDSGNISNHGTITISDSYLKANVKAYNNGAVLTKEIVKPTANIINKDTGTIETWVEVNSTLRADVADKTIFSTYSDEKYTNTILLRHTRDNTWQAIMSSDYNNISDISVADTLSDGMHLFTIKWSATEFTLFIDGVKTTATTNTPKLMSAVPINFNIGIGPKLNLVRNGYLSAGSSTNFAPLTYSTEDYYTSPASFKSINNPAPSSADYIAVDPSKIYYQSGYFKAVKVPSTTSNYYGFITYDADKNYIDSTMTNHYVNTETELAYDLNPGDTIAYVKSASNWKVSTDGSSYRYISIYNYKNYPSYTYTRNCYAFTNSSTVIDPVKLAYPITLTAAYAGSIVKAGTKVANGFNNYGTYCYGILCGAIIPNVWTKYSAYITASNRNQNTWTQFRYGTRYIKIVMLINVSNYAGEIIYIDDVEFIDTTNTIFNTKIQELCISNIARTDSEILRRYKKTVLDKDSNVTYMLTDK